VLDREGELGKRDRVGSFGDVRRGAREVVGERGRETGTRVWLDSWAPLFSRSGSQTARALHTLERGIHGGWRAAPGPLA
jgi:hypothetical protein